MKDKLQELNGLIAQAERAPLLSRAGLAMPAVKLAAGLLGEIVERIEQIERRETCGGGHGEREHR